MRFWVPNYIQTSWCLRAELGVKYMRFGVLVAVTKVHPCEVLTMLLSWMRTLSCHRQHTLDGSVVL